MSKKWDIPGTSAFWRMMHLPCGFPTNHHAVFIEIDRNGVLKGRLQFIS